jgi:hypothetical protein
MRIDKTASVYIEIAYKLKQTDVYDQYNLIKTVENMFETEADTDLGDFLNDIVVIYFSSLHSDSLEQEIIDKICETDLDQSMLYAVGKAVLAEC